MDSLENRAEFLIPALKVQNSFNFGEGFSILTSELSETLMASNYVYNIQLTIYHFLICVDSKSVLYTLQNWDCKVRKDIVYEVKYLVHCIMSRGIGIAFCRVPCHCGLYWNEISDKSAKQRQ